MSILNAYSDWPSKLEGIGTLNFDPHNPRLSRRGHQYTQQEIVAELLEYSDVRKIASSIANDGYMPVEQLIGFQDEAGTKYILEGNRRLADVKLIKEPRKAPMQYRSYFLRLHKRADLKQLTRLRVLWAPDRDSAWRLIVKKHTVASIVDWRPIMKANSYMQALDAGYSVEEAADVLGVTVADVKQARFNTQLYAAAQELDLDESLKEIVDNPYEFAQSTLERITNTNAGRRFLGIEMGADGAALLTTSRREFDMRLKRIVTDLSREQGETSRTINKAEQVAQYLKERTGFSANAPGASGRHPLLSSKPTAASTAGRPADPPKPPKRRRLPKKPLGLIPEEFQLPFANDRLEAILKELKDLSPATHPNACALLLRTFLELSTYLFLKDRNELEVWKRELPAPRPDWIPEFRPMLKRIVEKRLLSDAQLIKSLALHLQDVQYKPVFAQLNNFVHNHTYIANEARLREIWNDLAPFAAAVNLR